MGTWAFKGDAKSRDRQWQVGFPSFRSYFMPAPKFRPPLAKPVMRTIKLKVVWGPSPPIHPPLSAFISNSLLVYKFSFY